MQRRARDLTAVGTQLGAVYELRYRLESDRLVLDLVGRTSIELALGDADFFDLGFSPLFNSLPVIRDGLLLAGPARVYTMRWVDVPSLKVTSSEQRYEPLGRDMCSTTRGSPRACSRLVWGRRVAIRHGASDYFRLRQTSFEMPWIVWMPY